MGHGSDPSTIPYLIPKPVGAEGAGKCMAGSPVCREGGGLCSHQANLQQGKASLKTIPCPFQLWEEELLMEHLGMSPGEGTSCRAWGSVSTLGQQIPRTALLRAPASHPCLWCWCLPEGRAGGVAVHLPSTTFLFPVPPSISQGLASGTCLNSSSK